MSRKNSQTTGSAGSTMLGAPETAVDTGRLFPSRKPGRDCTVTEPDFAAIGNLGVRMAQRRELGRDPGVTEAELAAIGNLGVRMAQRWELGCGFLNVHNDLTPSNGRGRFLPRVEAD